MLAYVDTKNKLFKYIKANKLKVGDKLPSENQLSELLGVSRLTLREAINALKNEGVVYSVQGKGTFVSCNMDQIADTLNNNLSVTEMIELSGYAAGVQSFKKELVRAEGEIADKLNVNEGTTLVMCARIRTADGRPVVFSEDYLAPRLVEDFLSVTDENVSLYKFIENQANIEMGLCIAEIVPIKAEGDIAKMLELNEGDVLLKFKMMVNDAYGTPLIYSNEYLRVDSFKFLIHRWR
ncbi:MAG: GntR family transcriptional regulator [Christensenella sp.]|uniref:GntR family transcriptional regulator n=1 Tax=Christensenella sp. TaxID=1935934 RepID=UPI002B21EAE4|nr:GntR family transcriptional regulator [Christensenella sp.]MEA5001918.1 GntR family transcriptional regulator [Christensenella sp.]